MIRKSALLIGLLAAWLSSSPLRAADNPGYQIVVNAANPVKALRREEIARIFLRKVTTWPGGEPAVPVDQKTQSPVRMAFALDVLGRGAAEIAAYWNQMIFSGRRTPPLTQASDADVLAYVRANPNSIGYVAGGAVLGEGVKVLKPQK